MHDECQKSVLQGRGARKFWTEVHQVQKTDDLHQAQKANLMKRPAACVNRAARKCDAT